MVPFSLLNADGDIFNFKGGRKPMWACGLSRICPEAMREGWDLYSAFRGATRGGEDEFLCRGVL
jgi:hypothetical protein